MPDLFESAETETTDASLEELVGEGKKFRTLQDLAKGKAAADSHISNLEKELSELRQELSQRSTVEDFVSRLKTGNTTPASESEDNQIREPVASQEKPVMSLQEEVQKALRAEIEKSSREANVAKAKQALRERLGDDYNEKLKQIAEGLGVKPEFLSSMAASSPDGLVKIVESVSPQKDNRPLNVPSQTSVPNPQEGSRNFKFYQDLRRKDPGLYFSKRVQKEIHDQAMKQGQNFYQ